MSACATTEVDPEYVQYSEQMKTNITRYEACTKGHVAQYAQSKTASNAKIIKAALKQCVVYANNYCHAQVQRDALVAGSGVLSPDVETANEQICLEAFTSARRTALRSQLAKSRPQGATPGATPP